MWKTVKAQHYRKIPLWVAPLEALSDPTRTSQGRNGRYAEILDSDFNLKNKDELAKQSIILHWWLITLLKSRYVKGSRKGFRKTKYLWIRGCWTQRKN